MRGWRSSWSAARRSSLWGSGQRRAASQKRGKEQKPNPAEAQGLPASLQISCLPATVRDGASGVCELGRRTYQVFSPWGRIAAKSSECSTRRRVASSSITASQVSCLSSSQASKSFRAETSDPAGTYAKLHKRKDEPSKIEQQESCGGLEVCGCLAEAHLPFHSLQDMQGNEARLRVFVAFRGLATTTSA